MSRYFAAAPSLRTVGWAIDRLPGVLALLAHTDGNVLHQPLQDSHDDSIARAGWNLRDGGVQVTLSGWELDADRHRRVDAPVSFKEGSSGFVRNGVDDDVGTSRQGTRLAEQGRAM